MPILLTRSSFLILLCSIFLLTQNASAAINARVSASRISGVAPLAVFFDATSTTSTDSSKPFHDLYYAWDFDDQNAGKWRYGNPNNTDKNKDYGPVAAHVFETPGIYTVNLATKGLNGDTDSRAVTITVQDPNTVYSGNNTICFSNNSSFGGCPSGAMHITGASSDSIEDHIAPGKRLLLHRGGTWSGSRIDIDSHGPGTIGAFGVGNAPIFNNVGFRVAKGVADTTGIPDTKDWRIMDIEFVRTTQDVVSSDGEFENLLLLRLNAHNTSNSFAEFAGSTLGYYNRERGQQHDTHDGVFIVDCKVKDANSFAVGRRYAILGTSWDGTNYEHVNRFPNIRKGVIAHNYYTGAEDSNRHLIKLHAPFYDGSAWGGHLYEHGIETKDIVISDNHFEATVENWAVAVGPRSAQSYANEHVVDVIVERNLFKSSNGAPHIQLQTAGYDISVKNNYFDLSNAESGASAARASTRSSGQPDISGFWFYNNSIYRADAGARGAISSASNTRIHNNIVYSPTNNSTLGCSSGSNCSHNLVDVDPLWNNPNGNDFSPRPGSPAADSGFRVPVFDDFNGSARPGQGIDIGAVESNGDEPLPSPTISLTASPTSISAGGSSTLSWSTTNASTCTASDGWAGVKNRNGSQTVSPTDSAIYKLTCSGAGGSGSASAVVTVTSQQSDTTPPSIPANSISSDTTQSSTRLSWSASSDNVGVVSYNVYRNGTLITTTQETAVTIMGLSMGTTYRLTISAKDAAGNESSQSSPLSVTTLSDSSNDGTPPTTPTNTRASNTTETSTRLSWSASFDNTAVAAYNVYRNGTLMVTTENTATTITELSSGTTYQFTISATDMAGNESSQSLSLSVTTQSATGNNEISGHFSNWQGTDGYTIDSGLNIELMINDTAGVIQSVVFQVWSRADGVEAASRITTPPYVYQSSQLDTVALGSEKYVQALLQDSSGRIVHKVSGKTIFSETGDVDPPSIPTNIVLSNTTQNSITLSWDASTDNVGIWTYNIYRDGVLDVLTDTNNAIVSGLSAGTTYNITVSATDAELNESSQSASVSVTTLSDSIEEELSAVFSNWQGAEGYTLGSGLDLELGINDKGSVVKSVIFQVWSRSNGVEASYRMSSPPYVYQSTRLNRVAEGSEKYVQALLRDSSGNIIYRVSDKTTFTSSSSPDITDVELSSIILNLTTLLLE